MQNGMDFKTPHHLFNHRKSCLQKNKNFCEKHTLHTDEFLIKMANILQLKCIYIALVNPGNWSWETSCPLWPGQSKHPTFNTASVPLAHDPSPQVNNQPTNPTFHCKEIIKATLEGQKAQKPHRRQCKMSWAEIRNLNFSAFSCRVDQEQRCSSRSPGVTRTVTFVCFVISLPTTE